MTAPLDARLEAMAAVEDRRAKLWPSGSHPNVTHSDRAATIRAALTELAALRAGRQRDRAEIARLREALESIADRHIGDCPASLYHLSDEDWARRCHSDLRATARRALAPAPAEPSHER